MSNYRLLSFMAVLFVTMFSYATPYTILFDLDDVILIKDWSEIGKTSKWNLLKDVISHPKTVYDIIQTVKEGAAGQACLNIAEENGAKILANYIDKQLSAKIIIDGMESIIEQLNQHGHKLHIGTNMAKINFDEKIQPKHETLFNHFQQPLDSSIHNFTDYNVPKSEQVRKPKPEFFISWIEKMKNHDPEFNLEQVIFIDDKKENTESAANCGIKYVIHFRDVQQLKDAFQEIDPTILGN